MLMSREPGTNNRPRGVTSATGLAHARGPPRRQERDEYSTHDALRSRDRLRINVLGGVMALQVASA
jgi:hypothetical protein